MYFPRTITIANESFPRNIILKHRVDTGGVSKVYKCFILSHEFVYADHEYYAVKILKKKYSNSQCHINSFYTEFLVGQRLIHPLLAKCYDLIITDQYVFLIFEYIDGQSLGKLLGDNTNLSYAQKLYMLKLICDVIKYIHQNGIIHGDIKPSNILVQKDFSIKLIDFGLSRIQSEDIPNIQIAYSHLFSSPERLVGLPLSLKDDIFSFGCIAYYLLHGFHPFDNKSSLFAFRNNMHPQEIPGSIYSDLDQLIGSCISFNIAARPQNMHYISNLIGSML